MNYRRPIVLMFLSSLIWAQPDPSLDSLNAVVKQNSEENGLIQLRIPQAVGPMFMYLPPLDSLHEEMNRENDGDIIAKIDSPKNSSNDVLSTGTIYRSISLSPLAGTDMTGGIRMQIQGRLSENMQINGVLSDEQSPIQPEGNTQSLEEIDQIYIDVTHPQFQMTAGDITLDFNSGKYNNISKRLIGIKNNFNVSKWSGSAVFAGSKGHYRQKEFKGSEGKQGPYFLDSESGNRNIVVQAGTERLWLFGKRLVRGENRDYTIDYSTAELYFTPKHLIHSDSEILIEYQYTDFQYSENIAGGTMRRDMNERGSVTFSWLREKDQFKGASINLSQEEADLLKSAGDKSVTQSGIVPDSTGDYIFVHKEYYEYSPNDPTSADRFQITFSNDNEKGQYRRLISPTGEIYYEFVPVNMRNVGDDLYSTEKTIVSPVETQLLEISGEYSIWDNTEVKLSTAISDFDQNLISPKDDSDNTGLAYALALSNNAIQLTDKMTMRLSLNTWQENDRFHQLQRVRSATFYRDWNIQPSPNINEKYYEMETGLKLGEVGSGSVSAASYQYGRSSFNRLYSSFNGGIRTIPQLSFYLNDINGETGFFRQRRSTIEILPGNWHPFYNFMYEEAEYFNRFDHHTFGIKYSKNQVETSLGIGERLDYIESDSTSDGLEFWSKGLFGSFDFLAKNVNGWTQEIVIRRRIKNDKLTNKHYNFTLGRIQTTFRKPRHPVRWDLKASLEETFTESRSLVYDSVGVGLGDYRYDSDFNEYVSDPNGDYVAYTIFTGDRYPTTKLDGLQIFDFDFGKSRIKKLEDFTFRSEMRSIIEGNISTGQSFLYPELGDTSFSRSKWSMRNEIAYQSPKTNQLLKVWHQTLRNFDGLDHRGQDLRVGEEQGIEYRQRIIKGLTSEVLMTFHNDRAESTVSALRQRNSKGFWLDGVAKWRNEPWSFEGAVQYGNDQGTHRATDFSGQALGFRLDILRFIGAKGRVQSRFEWFQTKTDTHISSLPPEALNGLALGQTIRTNLQAQFVVGRGVSLNVSMNYISDQRYDQFITVNGEVRAYF
ncbi:MAG: hypothetical protein ACE5D0_06955 [Fidelibacterota bacterium]